MWRTRSYPGYAAVSGILARQDCPATRRTIVSLNNDGNIWLQTAFISYPDYTQSLQSQAAQLAGRISTVEGTAYKMAYSE